MVKVTVRFADGSETVIETPNTLQPILTALAAIKHEQNKGGVYRKVIRAEVTT